MVTATSGAAASEREVGRSVARVSPIWPVVIFLIGVFALAHVASRSWDRWNNYAGYGDLRIEYVCRPDAFCTVKTVTPGGPMAALGVRKGDAVRFDRGIDYTRMLRRGESVGFELRRDGVVSHHEASAAAPHALPVRPLAVLATWAAISLTGLLVALRSGRRASTLILGCALITLGGGGNFSGLTESDPGIFPAYMSVATLLYYSTSVLFPAFAVATWRESGRGVSRALKVVLLVFVVASILATAEALWGNLTARLLIDDALQTQLHVLLAGVGTALTILMLGLSWRESRGQDRTRYALMLVAISLLALSQDFISGLINATDNVWSMQNPLVVIQLGGSLAGAGVFAYAVLRHRVLDLGFAINRTLIYGVLSTLLLVAFGLIEWAVEHFMPRGGRETSVLIDAGVALAVFLTFHRVRDFVEHVVEGIFFRPWQQAEAALRRFVREAAFATRSETLTQAFAAALGRYAEGAGAAIYLRREDGGYERVDGHVAGVGEALDADDPALIAMRAQPKALVPDAASSRLKAVLIAPMVNRNEVIGLALIGPKPSGGDYRPDEIELVGWAARQVGLDLHALKVERLEKELQHANAQITGMLRLTSQEA